MVAFEFKCSLCRKNGPGLEVHHDKETMAEIVHKFADQFGWYGFYSSNILENDQTLVVMKDSIAQAVTDYHIQNNVSGVALCEKCHKKQHS